jgi:DNA-binding NtrC family response regulator
VESGIVPSLDRSLARNPQCPDKESFTRFLELLFIRVDEYRSIRPDSKLARVHEYFMSRSILIVDDDPVQRRLLEATLAKLGYQTDAAESGEAALEALTDTGRGEPAAMILDMVMPGMSGHDVLAAMRKRDIRLPVIVQTAQGSIEMAVSAMRGGAFDFVVKPASPERLRQALESALKVDSIESELRRKRGASSTGVSFDDLVGRGPAMERVVALARKAGRSDIPVLIEGESGVGKELVARAVRAVSSRARKPFVTVNCGAIPDTLVESILFGHEKGSFTGATDRHVGKFVEADGGTLFLDEIGELPPSAQVKLLRAVQDGEVDPVGARATVKVDIRLISATHRDLLQLVKDGKFREDLYYRLNVFPLQVPPLRARRDDIPELARHFIDRLGGRRDGRPVRGMSEDALELLMAYDWPGNLRELKNVVKRMVLLSRGEIAGKETLPEEMLLSIQNSQVTPEGPDLKAWQENKEKELILKTLEEVKYNKTKAARLLNIDRSTLYVKMEKYGIE